MRHWTGGSGSAERTLLTGRRIQDDSGTQALSCWRHPAALSLLSPRTAHCPEERSSGWREGGRPGLQQSGDTVALLVERTCACRLGHRQGPWTIFWLSPSLFTSPRALWGLVKSTPDPLGRHRGASRVPRRRTQDRAFLGSLRATTRASPNAGPMACLPSRKQQRVGGHPFSLLRALPLCHLTHLQKPPSQGLLRFPEAPHLQGEIPLGPELSPPLMV